MENQDLMDSFLNSVQEDARIGPNHISLFAGLVKISRDRGNENPLVIFSSEVMPVCKLTGATTYYRTLRELHHYGYISYIPSYNHFLGSLVKL